MLFLTKILLQVASPDDPSNVPFQTSLRKVAQTRIDDLVDDSDDSSEDLAVVSPTRGRGRGRGRGRARGRPRGSSSGDGRGTKRGRGRAKSDEQNASIARMLVSNMKMC